SKMSSNQLATPSSGANSKVVSKFYKFGQPQAAEKQMLQQQCRKRFTGTQSHPRKQPLFASKSPYSKPVGISKPPPGHQLHHVTDSPARKQPRTVFRFGLDKDSPKLLLESQQTGTENVTNSEPDSCPAANGQSSSSNRVQSDVIELEEAELEPSNQSESRGQQQQLSNNANINSCNEFFGLPMFVKDLLKKHKGIDKLYDWQTDCLSMPAVQSGGNLVYSLPTSGGKTLVAELLILQQLLVNGRDALFVLPFVSIVQEKVLSTSALGLELGFLVEEYAHHKGRLPPVKRRNRKTLYIATIEKALALVNSLIEEKRIEELGIVVVDELHMIGESGRGSTLESLITKIRFCSPRSRLVGMSATLSNLDQLASCLKASLFTGNFRPVQLKEYVKIEDTIYRLVTNSPQSNLDESSSSMTFVRRLNHDSFVGRLYPDKASRAADPDLLCGLVLEVIPAKSCLVFCQSKKSCESVANLLAKYLPRRLATASGVGDDVYRRRQALFKRLRTEDCDTGGGSGSNGSSGRFCPVLAATLPFGVAYHHSGLTAEERRCLEDAFAEGTLCVICCTSTLAAGVNLPAKRVIVRSPMVGAAFIGLAQYLQMVGRAGRAGLDTEGESVTIVPGRDRLRFMQMRSDTGMLRCRSRLHEGAALQSLILSSLTLGLARCRDDITSLLACSFWAVQAQPGELAEAIDTCLTRLDALKLLGSAPASKAGQEQQSAPQPQSSPSASLTASQLAVACVKGCVEPERANNVLAELNQALGSLQLDSYVHLLWLVVPPEYLPASSSSSTSASYGDLAGLADSARRLPALLDSLAPAERRAIEACAGLGEAMAMRLAAGRAPTAEQLPRLRRAQLTLVLLCLWRGDSVWRVSDRFSLTRGFVQQLLTSAAATASGLAQFVQPFDQLWGLQRLLPDFSQRLAHCVSPELLPLMQLPAVRRGRARQLYQAGFTSLSKIAASNARELSAGVAHLPVGQARRMVAAARMLVQDAAESLQSEARDLLDGVAGKLQLQQPQPPQPDGTLTPLKAANGSCDDLFDSS
ncbi:hypothetical protein BOX15_Mlig033108g1, partial [Macrostomum lignano]